MRIVGLRLTNYGRYRGDHELDLQGGVYAVVARNAANAQRSNWAGKTQLLSAVPWALYGKLPEQWYALDDAISWGEKEFAVDIELSDGTFITRGKRVGQSVQLKAVLPDGKGGELHLAQEAAQAALVERLGCNWGDFQYTSWLGQKDMARIIKADPATRTDVVVRWFGLEPLQRATEYELQQVTAHNSRLEELRRQLGVQVQLTAGVADRQVLVDYLSKAEHALAVGQADVQQVADAMTARTLWEAAKVTHDQIAACDARIATLETTPPPLPLDAVVDRVQRHLSLARSKLDRARDDVHRAMLAKTGQFDGQCPIMCDVCPVADKVRNAADALNNAYTQAQETKRRRDAWYRLWERTRESIVAQQSAWKRWQQQLDREMAVRRALAQQVRGTLGPEPPVVEATQDIDPLLDAVVQARTALERWDTAYKAAEQLAQQVKDEEFAVRVHQVSAQIFGKGGAQRRIATRALGQIQQVANNLLAGHGIDLTVALEYGRELATIADVCTCGRAFPKSAKVKQCDACGAPRGKKWDDKLYVVLSNVSGAAEDLAGVAIQLAAAKWRAVARGTAWGVLAIDEPFGALDAYNRGALAQALVGMAGGSFEQTFVIAHHNDVLDAMPHRLQITADGDWSRVEVV